MNNKASTKKANNTTNGDNQQTCAGCGMARAEWMGNNGQGFPVGDKTYCCQGCATGTGCTCQ